MPSSSSITDIPHRDIPVQSWGTALIFSIIIMVIGVAGWEINMRAQGLTTDDIDDGVGYWAYERRKLDEAKPNQIAIVGASRILFNTSLDIFENIAGARPVQLALAGTAGYIFIEDLANDPDFTGLLVIGYTPEAIINNETFYLSLGALSSYKTEAPSKKIGHHIQVLLNRVFAFLEADKRLFNEINHIEMKNRPGVPNIYVDNLKFDITEEDRQTYLWDKIITDENLHRRIVGFWDFALNFAGSDDGKFPDRVDAQITRLSEQVEKIRAKGGDVAFVRSPSIGFFKEWEEENFPRAQNWRKLIDATNSAHFHFEDHPLTKDMVPPELSHLSRTDAEIFTRVYVNSIMEQLNRPQLAD